MFYNHQIAKLNTLKMYSFPIVKLRSIQFSETAACRCLVFFKVHRKTDVLEPLF